MRDYLCKQVADSIRGMREEGLSYDEIKENLENEIPHKNNYELNHLIYIYSREPWDDVVGRIRERRKKYYRKKRDEVLDKASARHYAKKHFIQILIDILEKENGATLEKIMEECKIKFGVGLHQNWVAKKLDDIISQFPNLIKKEENRYVLNKDCFEYRFFCADQNF